MQLALVELGGVCFLCELAESRDYRTGGFEIEQGKIKEGTGRDVYILGESALSLHPSAIQLPSSSFPPSPSSRSLGPTTSLPLPARRAPQSTLILISAQAQTSSPSQPLVSLSPPPLFALVMGRTETARRAAGAARDASRPYNPKSAYSNLPSPTGLNFLPTSAPGSDSPPYSLNPNTVAASSAGGGRKVSHSAIPAAPSEDLPEGHYSLEPDEFGSYQGFPSVAEFDDIQETYLRGLSSRKQEKALITQAMYDAIHAVLLDPTNTGYGTPQFRFWVRKMFVLASFQGEYTVTHEEKPVAAKEQIYQILVHCHGECYHGGRDKTCAQIKQYYSWIPKELVAQFVKACPTCVLKRSNNPKKFVAMLKDIGGGQGTDDEYIDYFTSPVRSRQPQPSGLGSSGSKSAVRRPPPLLNFEESFAMHSQSSVYTPGSLEEGTAISQPFDRRRSSGSVSGTSSQLHTPLSAAFPGYHGIDNGGASGAHGWASSQHHGESSVGSAMMGRRAAHSAEEARLPSPAWPQGLAPHGFHSQQQQHLSAPGMATSLSEGSAYAQGHHQHHHHLPLPNSSRLHHPSLNSFNFNVTDNDEYADAPGSAGGAASSISYGHDYAAGAGDQEHGVGGSSQIVIKVEDPSSNVLLHGGRSNFANRRLGAPAALNLSASNFSQYRGDQALLSAVTDYPPSAPGSATDAYFPNPPRSAPLYGHHHQHLQHQLHSPGPASATAATFGGLNLDGGHQQSGLDVLSSASLAMVSSTAAAATVNVGEYLVAAAYDHPVSAGPTQTEFEIPPPPHHPAHHYQHHDADGEAEDEELRAEEEDEAERAGVAGVLAATVEEQDLPQHAEFSDVFS